MNYVLPFINYVLFGNIFVATGAVALTYASFAHINYSSHESNRYLILVFFATLFVYNFQRFFYKKNGNTTLHSIRRQWIFTHQSTIKALVILSALGIFISFGLNPDSKLIVYLAPLLILSLLYFSFAELRKHPWTKLLTLVSVWVMATATIPLLITNADILTRASILHIASRFCFMMAICIPFDIRDLVIDSADNITTLPHRIGEKKAKNFALLFIGLFTCILLSESYLSFSTAQHTYALQASALFTTLLIAMTKSERSEYFFVAGLDGTMLIQGLLILLASSCC